jgi:hypothetical protein
MRSTAARWCSARPGLGCQDILGLRGDGNYEKKLNIKGFYTQIGDGEVAGQEGECVVRCKLAHTILLTIGWWSPNKSPNNSPNYATAELCSPRISCPIVSPETSRFKRERAK